MNWIILTGCFVVLMIIFVILIMSNSLKKTSNSVGASRYIVNKFEPDNTAPKITELIEFHKANTNLEKYSID